MTDSMTTTRQNFALNVTEGAFFGFAVGAASFGTVIPLFVSQLTDSAILIALIPYLHQLGWQLPQLLTVQRVARLQRFLPEVLRMSLNQRLPFLGLALVALLVPFVPASVVLTMTFVLLLWQGLGGGVTATAWQSMIAKIIPSSRIGLFFGTQSAASALAGAFAAPLAGYMLETINPNYNFAAVFGLAFASIAMSWFILSRTREQHVEPPATAHLPLSRVWQETPALLRADPNFVRYLMARWVIQLGMMGASFFTIYAVTKHGVGALEVGTYTSVMLLSQMVASPVLGWFGDRIGHRTVMGIGFCAMVFAVLVAWAAPSGEWFFLVYCLAGIGTQAYWSPNLAIIFDFAPADKRQLYIGLGNTLVAPAALIAPLLGGWLADTVSYEAAFAVSALAGIVTVLILLVVVREPRRKPVVDAPVML